MMIGVRPRRGPNALFANLWTADVKTGTPALVRRCFTRFLPDDDGAKVQIWHGVVVRLALLLAQSPGLDTAKGRSSRGFWISSPYTGGRSSSSVGRVGFAATPPMSPRTLPRLPLGLSRVSTKHPCPGGTPQRQYPRLAGPCCKVERYQGPSPAAGVPAPGVNPTADKALASEVQLAHHRVSDPPKWRGPYVSSPRVAVA